MLKFEFKDANPERKQEMLTDIISKYNVANRNELIQCLGHSQAVLDCNQDEFASHPSIMIATRTLRTYKKEYLDLYVMAYEKYQPTGTELKDVDAVINEDVLESVYANLLARLQSNKSSTKDISLILEYFGVSANEFKQYATFRNSTMRAYVADNLQTLVPEDETALLIKSVIAESPFLYQGTEKTLGNTVNALKMDLDNPIVRLEAQALGLLFISLFNGNVTEAFVNHAESLRLLKLASGRPFKDMEYAHRDFDRIDGKTPATKPIAEKDLIDLFGANEGRELFAQFNSMKKKVDTKTAIKMPKYEDVKEDYEAHLKVYPELNEMPFRVMLAKLSAKQDKQFMDKYKEFLEVNED